MFMKNKNILIGGILGILAGLFTVFIVNALASNPTGQSREFVTRTPTEFATATAFSEALAVLSTTEGQPESDSLLATPRYFYPTNTPVDPSKFNSTPTRVKTATPTYRPNSTLVDGSPTATKPNPVGGSSGTGIPPTSQPTAQPTSQPTQPPAPTSPPPTQVPPPEPTPVPPQPTVMPTAVPPPPEPTEVPPPPPPEPTPEG